VVISKPYLNVKPMISASQRYELEPMIGASHKLNVNPIFLCKPAEEVKPEDNNASRVRV
jgi:hypothetical protein